MRFKVDENLPVDVAEVLRAAGHEAATVTDEAVGGAPDPDIAALVRSESRALLTLDVGFGDIRSYPPADYQGLVVLRLATQDKEHVLAVCRRLTKLLPADTLAGQLWIVEESRIRVRRAAEQERGP